MASHEARDRARIALASLSPQQLAVLREMVRGHLNKQIAFTLNISENTVKMHRARMLDRLGVASAAEAIRLGIEAGLP